VHRGWEAPNPDTNQSINHSINPTLKVYLRSVLCWQWLRLVCGTWQQKMSNQQVTRSTASRCSSNCWNLNCIKVLRFEGMFWNCFGNFCILFLSGAVDGERFWSKPDRPFPKKWVSKLLRPSWRNPRFCLQWIC